MKIWDIISGVDVSEDDLRRALKAVNLDLGERPMNERGFNARADILAGLFAGESNKVLAVNFRIEALGRLADHPQMRAWTPPKGESAGTVIPTHSKILAAAAAHPLVEIDGEPGFEPEEFFSNVLSLTTGAGEA
jgi:hypothetical protein